MDIEEVFKSQEYLNIMKLIFEYNFAEVNITFPHLKHFLVENYKLGDYEQKFIGQLLPDSYVANEEKFLEKLESLGIFDRNCKIASVNVLRQHYLPTLRQLKLVELNPKKNKKSYPFYTLTDKCLQKFIRFQLHLSIDKLIPDTTALLGLQYWVIRYKMKNLAKEILSKEEKDEMFREL